MAPPLSERLLLVAWVSACWMVVGLEGRDLVCIIHTMLSLASCKHSPNTCACMREGRSPLILYFSCFQAVNLSLQLSVSKVKLQGTTSMLG